MDRSGGRSRDREELSAVMLMTERLRGKSILVAGGGGIGGGLVRRLAAEGASVVIGDVSREAAQALAADIGTDRVIGTELDGADVLGMQLGGFAVSVVYTWLMIVGLWGGVATGLRLLSIFRT